MLVIAVINKVLCKMSLNNVCNRNYCLIMRPIAYNHSYHLSNECAYSFICVLCLLHENNADCQQQIRQQTKCSLGISELICGLGCCLEQSVHWEILLGSSWDKDGLRCSWTLEGWDHMCIKLSISLLRCWLDPAKQCLAKVNQNLQNAKKPKNVYECQTMNCQPQTLEI